MENHRRTRRGLFFWHICFLLMLSTTSHAAMIQGKVISIKGDVVELNLGSDQGLKEGNTGKVYYTVKVSGEPNPQPEYVARFKVTFISKNASMAKIEETNGDIQVGYMVEVTVQSTAQEPPPQKVVEKEPQPGEVWKDPHLGMEFVWVPGGCYEMGDVWGDGYKDEKPVQTVCVDGFWMGKYEVTQGEWQRIMGNNPSRWKKDCGENCPVQMVSWNKAVEFAHRLSQRAGYTFRLPTEAEWEYACRSGGRQEKYSGGDDMEAVAWYKDNSGGRPHPVGQKRSNGLGIYDMSGNVWEWCDNCYDWEYFFLGGWTRKKYYDSRSPRALRGGSEYEGARRIRCAARGGVTPSMLNCDRGFRLVRVGQQ